MRFQDLFNYDFDGTHVPQARPQAGRGGASRFGADQIKRAGRTLRVWSGASAPFFFRYGVE
jgi:hypothetical protein